MGGQSKLTPDNFNTLCGKWIRSFLEHRCVVRQNRWEYISGLYLAYTDYAKRNSAMGINMALTMQRFARVLTLVFKENNWFMDLATTPNGGQRVRAGLCLKENSSKRAPEDLYPSMRIADAKLAKANRRQSATLEAKITSPHFNPESADRATEDPGKAQIERDRIAQDLWNKG